MEAKQVKRVYQGTDAYMTQEARIVHGLVNTDLARFTAFDSTFTAASQTAFLASITAADTVVDDVSVTGQMVQTTENLNAAMESAKAKYNDVKFFVLKAFPNSKGAQIEFGLTGYDSARKSPTKMIQLFDDFSKAAVKYQAQLVAAGLNAAGITAIATLRTDLQNKNSLQKTAKTQRPKLTEDRIIILNTCYDRMALINAAAQAVYANDYAKQKQFVYNPYGGDDDLEFSGTVAAGHIAKIAEIPFSEDDVFTFMNTGSVPLGFCLSSSENIEGIEVIVAAGAEVTKTAEELNANAENLLVRNADAVAMGNYSVAVEQ